MYIPYSRQLPHDDCPFIDGFRRPQDNRVIEGTVCVYCLEEEVRPDIGASDLGGKLVCCCDACGMFQPQSTC